MNCLARVALVAAAVVCARPAVAQQAAAPAASPLDFSGWLFGSYNMRTDSAAKATLGGKAPNQFSVDRAYLTFKMPAGDNGSVRVTADLFQNTSTAATNYYGGWAVRLKYAYFQYTGMRERFGAGSSLSGRVGLVHHAVIDYQETFWPRYFQQVALERAGFFASSDAGVAGILTLGKKMGEIYGEVINGGGYTSPERDRFKDIAIRAAFTPFANSATMNRIVKSFAIAPWVYMGKTGSTFAAGGAAQIGPGDNGAVTDGLTRNRYGIFAGLKDRRLTAGLDLAQRKDESETGLNTTATPRAVTDSTGSVLGVFILARPIEWMDASKKSSFGVVARFDKFTPNTSPTSANYAGTTPSYSFVLVGAQYDLTQRITLALDWQVSTPSNFPPATGTNVRATTPKASTLFLHWQATF